MGPRLPAERALAGDTITRAFMRPSVGGYKSLEFLSRKTRTGLFDRVRASRIRYPDDSADSLRPERQGEHRLPSHRRRTARSGLCPGLGVAFGTPRSGEHT